MTTPRIKVRLVYVSRDNRELDWLDKAQEVHSIGMELIDANTRDGGKGTIYFYSVDPAVCSFIAGTKIGEEFDLALMPTKKPSETTIKDDEDAWNWCREHGASYNIKESDRKLDELTGTMRSIQAHEAIVDTRLNTIDARINAQRVQVDNLHLDVQRSFQHVAVAQQQMEDRLNKRLDVLSDRLAQVIALLTKAE